MMVEAATTHEDTIIEEPILEGIPVRGVCAGSLSLLLHEIFPQSPLLLNSVALLLRVLKF